MRKGVFFECSSPGFIKLVLQTENYPDDVVTRKFVCRRLANDILDFFRGPSLFLKTDLQEKRLMCLGWITRGLTLF